MGQSEGRHVEANAMTQAHTAALKNRAAWPFVGDRGLRSGWRVLIFFALIAGLATACMKLLRAVGLKPHSGPLTADIALLGETILIISLLVATAVMARFEGRRLGSYGLGLRAGFLRRFSTGAIWGIVPLAALLVGLRALHVADFGSGDVAGRALLRAGMLWALAYILTGIFEQSALHGYPLYTLMCSVGFWPAAVITSALFALVHVGNSGEAIVGLVAVFVVGMIFCLMVRRTGDLWFAIGNHFAWDYGETFIFGVPNSGTTAAGHLLTTHLHGSRWLTGGSVGPEGSLLVFVVLGLLALAFHYAYPRAKLVVLPSMAGLRDGTTADPALRLG